MEHDELCERVCELSVKVENLEMWQGKQNGSLKSMDGRIEKMDSKIDAVKTWLIGVMGGVIVSLLLLIVNLFIGR